MLLKGGAYEEFGWWRSYLWLLQADLEVMERIQTTLSCTDDFLKKEDHKKGILASRLRVINNRSKVIISCRESKVDPAKKKIEQEIAMAKKKIQELWQKLHDAHDPRIPKKEEVFGKGNE